MEADHLADAVPKMVIGGLRQVIDGVAADIQRTGCDFVQMWLPDVDAGGFDQGNLGLLVSPQAVAQLGRQLEPSGSAPDDHDVMERRIGDANRRGATRN
jgi:hypothetical protein